MTGLLRLWALLAMATVTTFGGAPGMRVVERRGTGVRFGRRERVVYCGVGFDAGTGRRVSVFSDGRTMPILSGGDDPDPPPPPDPNNPPAPAPDLAGLQAVLDDAKRTGQTEATSTVLQALGFDKIEDAQAWVTSKRAEETAKLTEVEQKERAAAEREAAAAKREQDAAAKAQRADIRAALIEAGAPKEMLGDLVDIIKVPADADEAAIKAAVEAKKTAVPQWFAAPGAPPPSSPPAPSSLPGGGPPPSAPPADPLEAGRKRAEQVKAGRHGATKEDLIASFTPRPSPLATSN